LGHAAAEIQPGRTTPNTNEVPTASLAFTKTVLLLLLPPWSSPPHSAALHPPHARACTLPLMWCSHLFNAHPGGHFCGQLFLGDVREPPEADQLGLSRAPPKADHTGGDGSGVGREEESTGRNVSVRKDGACGMRFPHRPMESCRKSRERNCTRRPRYRLPNRTHGAMP